MRNLPSRRQLKSFSHSVLVAYVQEHCFIGETHINRLIAIEERQRTQKLLDRMKAICEEQKEVRLPQDFKKWHALNTEWDKIQKQFDKIFSIDPIPNVNVSASQPDPA